MAVDAKQRRAYASVKAADCFVVLSIAVVLAAGFARPAYAYVDPSVMTYTIQALAGVAVALSAVIGVAWRRLRKFLFKALRIDPNAGKEADASVHRIEGDDAERARLRAEADERARRLERSLDAEKPVEFCRSARFLFALAASAMLFFTVVVAGPLEIVAASPESLMFSVDDVAGLLVAAGVAATIVSAAAMSCLKGRAFGFVFAATAVLGIAAYVQATFMNASLPPADGSQVDWGSYLSMTLLTGAVWVALFASAAVLSWKKPLAFTGSAAALCLVGIVAQGISLGLVLLTPGDDGYTPLDDKPTVTMEGISEVSSRDNVIVFVLDTFDTEYLRRAVETDPTCLDAFTGFTWFENSTGSMIPTRYAMSTLLTGRSLAADDASYSTRKIADWYTQPNLLDDIAAQGYAVDLYATDIYDAIGALEAKAGNIKPLACEIDRPAALAMLVECALYRDLPWALKPLCWFYTDEVNNEVLVEHPDDPSRSVWKMDDAGYYDLLSRQRLTAVEKGEAGSFRVIHMAGTHAPYTIGRDGLRVEGEGGMIEQGLGALHIVEAYLDELKRLGLYDSATIVVTADHGDWYLADEISGPTNPMLLAKPASSGDASRAPLKVSQVPTGHLDFAATILDAVGGDPSTYGGMNMFDVPDEPRTRYFCSTSVVGPDNEYTRIKEWRIDGEATDWSAWHATGTEWPIE